MTVFYVVFTRKDEEPLKICGVGGVRLSLEEARSLAYASCLVKGYHMTINRCDVEGDLPETLEDAKASFENAIENGYQNNSENLLKGECLCHLPTKSV